MQSYSDCKSWWSKEDRNGKMTVVIFVQFSTSEVSKNATEKINIQRKPKEKLTPIWMWYVPHHVLHNSKTPLYMFLNSMFFLQSQCLGEEQSVSLCWVDVSCIWHQVTSQVFCLVYSPPRHILGVKTFYAWRRLHGHYHWPWISTLGNSPKLQQC